MIRLKSITEIRKTPLNNSMLDGRRRRRNGQLMEMTSQKCSKHPHIDSEGGAGARVERIIEKQLGIHSF